MLSDSSSQDRRRPLTPSNPPEHRRTPSGPTLLVLGAAATLLAVSLATRIALLWAHGSLAVDGLAATLACLAVGTAYDLVVTPWLVLPIALALIAMRRSWWQRPWLRAALWTGVGVWLYGVLFTAAAEWFFFDEFDSRFNFVAVDYLLYPTEVLENIWQSYPTGWILAGLAVVVVTAIWAARRALAPAGAPQQAPRRRVGLAAAVLLAAIVGAVVVSPVWREVSNDRALNEIASNGAYSFFAALRGSNATYRGLYATRQSAVVFDRLRDLLAEPAARNATFAADSTLRQVDNALPPRRLNVVVVLEESLGSEFVGLLRRGVEDTLTPHLDALASEGTLLTHAYSTGNRTIRAIEATTASLPPLPGISVVRRPQSEDLFTLPALLAREGWQTLFVYGGRALFDGMGGYLRRNGVERVVEQADYPDGTFTTAWGVADEAIFDRTLVEMDRMADTGKPFCTLVLSVSNHRPYLFPEDHVQPDPALKPRQNAVRYADWALGNFMTQAKKHPWYDDTLFVLMGDHGARVYGAAAIPLASYEVPVLFIGPRVPAGERLSTLASSLDIPPTLLGRLGLSYGSRFFGHDLFAVAPERGRALMTHNNDIALLRGNRLAVLGLHESTTVYSCDLETVECEVEPQGSAEARDLIEDAIAYYDGANTLYTSGRYLITTRDGDGLAVAAAPGEAEYSGR